MHDDSDAEIGIDDSLDIGNAVEVRRGAVLFEEGKAVNINLLTSVADGIVASDHLHTEIVIGRMDIAAAMATSRDGREGGEGKGRLKPWDQR